MADKRISEEELVLPTLYVIHTSPGVTTSQLIPILAKLLNPTGKDAEIIKNRNDTYFSQKVRNLVSHRKLANLGYATYSKIGKSGAYAINEHGKRFLEVNRDNLEYLFGENFNYQYFNYQDIIDTLASMTKMSEENKESFILDENIEISEGTKQKKNVQIYERSRKLRELAINHYNQNGHLKCCVCSFDFYDYYGDRGRGFIEIHHLKPLLQYEDEDINKFIKRALQNVVPVCSNCHRMIHRERNDPMPIEELKRLVQKLNPTSGQNPDFLI